MTNPLNNPAPRPDLDEELLRRLFQGPLVLEQVAHDLLLPPEQVRQSLQELSRLGYQITTFPHRGIILQHSPDILIADETRARLPENIFARQLRIFKETRSTNDLVFQAGVQGAPEGFCVLAESQTHGRGRNGRCWQTTAGKGLYLSLLFRPSWPPERAACLTYLTSVAFCRAAARLTGIRCGIKWPNDVLYQNKKIAGILTEARSQASRLEFAVVGIGINVHQQPGDFPEDLRARALSLGMAGAAANLRRAELLAVLLEETLRLYRAPWEDLRTEWKSLCLSTGQPLRIQCGRRIVEGQMIDIEENGHLVLRLPDGKIEVINSGEIL